jgi:SHS2 domain-containing protein
VKLPQRYRELDHTADVGFEVEGRTREEVFERAALALSDVMSGGIEVPVDEAFAIEARGDASGDAQLLVQFLKAVLAKFQDGLLAGEVQVEALAPAEVRARARGWRYDASRLEGTEVKAVTYHALAFEQRGDAFLARVVLDI